VGYFFFRPPPTSVVVLESGGEGGVVGVRTKICIEIPSVWGGRDGWRTIMGGCRYHTKMSRTMLGRVSIVVTWKSCMLDGG
jgi:hypothetical protein